MVSHGCMAWLSQEPLLHVGAAASEMDYSHCGSDCSAEPVSCSVVRIAQNPTQPVPALLHTTRGTVGVSCRRCGTSHMPEPLGQCFVEAETIHHLILIYISPLCCE